MLNSKIHFAADYILSRTFESYSLKSHIDYRLQECFIIMQSRNIKFVRCNIREWLHKFVHDQNGHWKLWNRIMYKVAWKFVLGA